MPPARTREYLRPLTPDDYLRYRITTDQGQVVDFVLQYETNVGGHFLPVVRYDRAHGYLHRDTLDSQGNPVDKQPVPMGPGMSLKQALADADADLRSNWQRYRRQFLRPPGRP